MLALEAYNRPGDIEILFLMDKMQGKKRQNPVLTQVGRVEAIPSINLESNGPIISE